MCIGPLAPPKPPPMPKPQGPAPTVKAAQARPEMVEPEKIKEETGDDEKIDRLYKRQQAMKFGKKMNEAAYPGHDEQGKPLPKEDKRMTVHKADMKLPAGKKFKAGDPRYKAGDDLKK